MSVQTAKGVVVRLPGDPRDPEFIERLDRATERSPYRLASADAVEGGPARCLLVRRDGAPVGDASLVDLLELLRQPAA